MNILSLDEDAEVNCKVADFGLSRQAAPTLGEILPTWQWLAPEVIDASNTRGYDEKSDVYSFGIVCWELATCLCDSPFGEYALRDRTVIQKIIHEELRPTIPENVPENYAKLIRACWQTDPSKRPSFEYIVEQLNAMLGLPSAMDDSL